MGPRNLQPSVAPTTSMDSQQVIKTIQQRLAESGDYEKYVFLLFFNPSLLTRLSSQLQEMLQQAGWFDDVKALALDVLSGQKEPDLRQTSSKIHPQAMSMVPDQIKLDLLQKIRLFVDSNIESAP